MIAKASPRPSRERWRRSSSASELERFSFSRKRRTALSFCFYAIPNGKPLRTFPGIALSSGCARIGWFAHPHLTISLLQGERR
ncbi:hypothetical protein E0H38_18160 [Rhizobium leguminosarum bv. viciae]|nr:hypothetical protein E0H33_18985 [Rhizobium leguminosarum bv. viciae]TBZ16264.1 hypothetical protein E0H38_18160 [Rhizobium leguminosarum bv. viciae]